MSLPHRHPFAAIAVCWIAVLSLAFTGCAGARPAPASKPAGQGSARGTPEASPGSGPSKSRSQEAPAGSGTLFERLGGMPALDAVVTDFVGNVAADERINAPFAVADLKLFHQRLVEFVCVAAGGPCKYTGRDMRAAHRGMGVTNVQFDALVGALVKTLEKFKVPEREKSELLGALGPLREQIVEAE